MNSPIRPIILASASPRRYELLSRLEISFSVMVSGVDEEIEDESQPDVMVIHVAGRKALAIASTLTEGIVIGADTTVIIDGLVLNKPSDADDARRMLQLLRGRVHEVWTGVVLVNAATNRIETGAVRSLVQMRTFSAADIDAYVATGEPLDKAGAYAIQGGAGTFVECIEGCYTNVVGLPLCELSSLLKSFDVKLRSDDQVCKLADGSPCPRWSTFRA